MLEIVVSAVSLGMLGLVSLYFVESGHCTTKSIMLTIIYYPLSKIALMLSVYDLFLNSLMVAYTMVDSLPESIFITKLLYRLAKGISMIISLGFGYWIPTYCEVLSRSQGTKGADLFGWVLGIGRSFETPPFERRGIQGLMVAVGVIILRDTIIFGLNFTVHYKYYMNRIQKNSERITVLRAMNDAINAGYTGDIDVICRRLIQVISKNGTVIKYDDLLAFFDEATSKKIMELCGSEDDGEIAVEEIKEFYKYTMLEQERIVKSLKQNNETIHNFRRVLDVLFIPAAFLYFIKVAKIQGPVLKGHFNIDFLGALLFSTGYCFSDNIKAFLNSLSFVFFIRPYEVEDVIIVKDKVYKVSSINLLTTVLLKDSKLTVFPNSVLITESITNLSLRKTWDEHFTFDFSFEQFEIKKDEFLARLADYVRKRPTKYRKNPYFSNITLKEGNKINARLTVKLNLDSSDLDIIRERRSKLLFVISRMFHSCDIVPYKYG